MSVYKCGHVDATLIHRSDISACLINKTDLPVIIDSYASGSTVRDYESLVNKPSINDVTLVGNKTGNQLSLINTDDILTEQDIDRIVYGGL